MTEKGVPFETVNYIEKPLSADGLKELLAQAGLKPHQVLRTKEGTYREQVEGKSLSDEQLLTLMARHPELIQRPIVVRGKRAVLAREIEKLEDLGIK